MDGSTGTQVLIDEGDTVYFMRFSDGIQALARAGIRKEAGILKWLLYSGGTYKTCPIAVSADIWYDVELHWNSTKGIAEMFVNGRKILQINVSSDYKISAEFIDIGIMSTRNVQNQLKIDCDSFTLSTTYVGSEIDLVYPPWDINQDGKVDILDIAIINSAYATTSRSQNWNPQTDINKDGTVDLLDVVLVMRHYGERYV